MWRVVVFIGDHRRNPQQELRFTSVSWISLSLSGTLNFLVWEYLGFHGFFFSKEGFRFLSLRKFYPSLCSLVKAKENHLKHSLLFPRFTFVLWNSLQIWVHFTSALFSLTIFTVSSPPSKASFTDLSQIAGFISGRISHRRLRLCLVRGEINLFWFFLYCFVSDLL